MFKTKESIDNPKPLSPKTLQGYNDTINTQIIPYFKNNKNISLLTEKNFKDCIMSFNGYFIIQSFSYFVKYNFFTIFYCIKTI